MNNNGKCLDQPYGTFEKHTKNKNKASKMARITPIFPNTLQAKVSKLVHCSWCIDVLERAPPLSPEITSPLLVVVRLNELNCHAFRDKINGTGISSAGES